MSISLDKIVKNTEPPLSTPEEDTFLKPQISFRSKSLKIDFKADLAKQKKPDLEKIFSYHWVGEQVQLPARKLDAEENELEIFIAIESDKRSDIWHKFINEMDNYGKSYPREAWADITLTSDKDKRIYHDAFIAEMGEAEFPGLMQVTQMESFLDEEEYEISAACVCKGYKIKFRFLNFEAKLCI